MAANEVVVDAELRRVLQAATLCREQSLAVLNLLRGFDAAGPHELDEEERLALSKQQKLLNAHLTRLRGLNRQAIYGVRDTKQETAEARQEVDRLRLELQNLYYEQSHLRGEIIGCQEYPHRYRQLPLITSEEFLQRNPHLQKVSEHELTVARINDETASRRVLHEEKEMLQKKKDALIKETTAKKDELAKLDAEIEAWVIASEGPMKTIQSRDGAHALSQPPQAVAQT